jgi:hypothetical protein
MSVTPVTLYALRLELSHSSICPEVSNAELAWRAAVPEFIGPVTDQVGL